MTHDTAALLERIAGRRIVASISGGKDSAALSLFLREAGVEHERVFLDTGWEHPLTYEYLRGPLAEALGPITELRGPKGMEELVRSKGMFPSRIIRYCTQELKVYPMQRHLNALVEAGHDVVNAVGIRADESEARSRMDEWEWADGFDCEVWRPLLRWSEADVIAIHHRHGLRPNPLYLMGATRVGCWPCINSRKEEIRLTADLDPERIGRIRALEEELSARVGKKLAFFQTRRSGKNDPWPIDDALAWARTSHGGSQFEMFAAAGRDQGCMRWGMCDTGAKAQEEEA